MSPAEGAVASNGAMTSNGTGGAQLVLSPPPPDVIQPVVEVGVPAATMSADAPLTLSEPPPDVIQPVVEVPFDAAPPATAQALGDDLSVKDTGYTDVVPGEPAPEQPEPEPAAELTNEEIYRIVREVAVADSGDAGYAAVSRDLGPVADGGRRFGLGYGLLLATQESGRLGAVLRLMHGRDAVRFVEFFGPHADALLATTNAATPEERLAPVGGQPLSSEEWVARFVAAAAVPEFQAAQNEEAIEGRFRPMLRVAGELGLVSDRGLAMALDRVVVAGLGGGLSWIVATAGPLRTVAQRQHALTMLGYADLTAFQTSTGWTPVDGRFGPETHAALVGALRRQGAAALPDADDLASRLARRATGPAARRLARLRDSTAFTDVRYRIGP